MPTFFRDIRRAARQLRKSPVFSATVVLALALGIGATTAIFSLVQGILLRPLPFADPERLVIMGDHIGDSPRLPATAREIKSTRGAQAPSLRWAAMTRSATSSQAATLPNTLTPVASRQAYL